MKGVQIATLSTAYRMKMRVLLAGGLDLKMLSLAGWFFIDLINVSNLLIDKSMQIDDYFDS